MRAIAWVKTQFKGLRNKIDGLDGYLIGLFFINFRRDFVWCLFDVKHVMGEALGRKQILCKNVLIVYLGRYQE